MEYPHLNKYYKIRKVDTRLASKIGVALNVIGFTYVVLVWAIAIASLGVSACRGTFVADAAYVQCLYLISRVKDRRGYIYIVNFCITEIWCFV